MIGLRRAPEVQSIFPDSLLTRLAPSLCISYSTKSDIHAIIMNPQMGGDITVRLSAPHFGKKVIQYSYNTLDKRT